ncbi:TolC family protein [Psychroserpens jangbogonensis]|uniref:TolC family protein n=1 Tax=Psychroserpens jangbogonensis TaxID=1484460 RepID=UPI00053EA4FD|nr:TolC family protein [Psychroserpens jangbogonensis]
MNKKITLIISIWLSITNFGFSQNTVKTIYTLQDCIDISIENNLDLKIKELRAASSEINFKENRNKILPSLNMNYNLGINNGRSIDPFTNSYINQELTFSNAGLNLDATIFNGFRIKNEIKQSRFNMQASEMEIVEAKQNLTLEVTLLYIQILNNRDVLELSKARLTTTKVQLKRLESQYNNGLGNPSTFTDIQGQYTRDQTEIITAENNLKSTVLNLVKLLSIDLDSENEFENIFEINNPEKYQNSANDIYNDALENLATFKSKQLRIDAAKTGIKIARSNYFPEVSLFGQLNTNYSSAAQIFTQTGTSTIETGDFVSIGGQEHNVLRNEGQFEGSKINYKDQFENNRNSVVGIAVRVPLFNGFRAKNKLRVEKIQLEEAQINLNQIKFIFKQSIQESYNNMEASFKRYQILKNQVTAYEESFRVNEVRFNSGVSNIVEYITSKNNMEASKLNLSQTKYEYLLRVKVLDYYRGI